MKEIKEMTEAGRAAAAFRAGLISGEKRNTSISAAVRQLNSARPDNTALITETGSYTYGEMFRLWDSFAAVFTALGITGRDGAHAGILMLNDAEPVCAYFALNMLSVTVSCLEPFMDPEKLTLHIRKEKITDLVASDTAFSPAFVRVLLQKKDELGLRHIILLKNSYDWSLVTPPEQRHAEDFVKQLHEIPGLLFMEDLVERYADTPVIPCEEEPDHIAAIFRTSGSFSGKSKPIPMTNRQLISAAAFVLDDPAFQAYENCSRSILEMDFSHLFFHNDQMLTVFFMGGTLILLNVGRFSRSPGRLMEEYRVNLWVTSPQLIDFVFNPASRPDLSSLKLMICGGGMVSADMKRRYNACLRERGSTARVRVGYGLTETGGACILAPVDAPEDNAIGYPLPGVSLKLQDESDGSFHDISEGERTGGLYVSTEALSSGRLDGKTCFELTVIDGKPYLCTNDLFHVSADGLLTCCGRMNRYFTSFSGIRFDAGLVEAAMVLQPGIQECVIQPGYCKSLNDTIPVMFIQTIRPEDRLETVKRALRAVFIDQQNDRKTVLPTQVIFVDRFPVSQAGKVDRLQLNASDLALERFNIRPVYEKDRLTDLLLMPSVGGVEFQVFLPRGAAKEGGNMISRLIAHPAEVFDLPPNLTSVLIGIVSMLPAPPGFGTPPGAGAPPAGQSPAPSYSCFSLLQTAFRFFFYTAAAGLYFHAWALSSLFFPSGAGKQTAGTPEDGQQETGR